MSWIEQIDYSQADAALKQAYDQIKGPGDYLDNVVKVHSLRPHTLVGHLALYRSVLHHANNRLPRWYLEALGVYTSRLNGCEYCTRHHSAGLRRLLAREPASERLIAALLADDIGSCFHGREAAGLQYAKKLTAAPQTVAQSDIVLLRESGFSDGEILEINQVVSYFNYVNRSVLGLGVSLTGDDLGPTAATVPSSGPV